MDPGPIAGQIILIIVLTIVNAFFAAAEMSMVALDKKKLEYEASEGDRRSARILEVLKEQSRFLSTIQVGITFAGFFNSASAATGISQLLGDKLAALNVPFARDIAFFGITLILIYTSLVFGELVPKRVALNNSIKFAKFSVGPISLVAKVLSPFVSLLSVSTNTVLRVLGIPLSGVEEKVTIEEIRSMVQVGQEQGVINPRGGRDDQSVINFDDKTAEEIADCQTRRVHDRSGGRHRRISRRNDDFEILENSRVRGRSRQHPRHTVFERLHAGIYQ